MLVDLHYPYGVPFSTFEDPAPVFWRAAIFIAGLVGLPHLAAPAAAAPVITVKGRAVLKLLHLAAEQGRTVLLGELQDGDIDSALADRSVELMVAAPGGTKSYSARTDAQGRFRVSLPAQRHPYQLEARFAGDHDYAALSLTAASLSPTKPHPQIELHLERELDLSQPRQKLRITTHVVGFPIGLPLRLQVAEGKELGQLTTPPTGTLSTELPTASLGPAGHLRLIARFEGSSKLNATTAQIQALLVTPVRVTLRAPSSSLFTDESLDLEGTVADLGGPLAAATISLEAMGRHLVSGTSDARGRFGFTVNGRDFPPGPVNFVARYTPGVPWRRASRSPALEIAISPPAPIPLRWYAVPLLATLLALVALCAARRWRGAPSPAPRVERLLAEADPAPVESGARLSHPTLRSLVKSARDIRGVVWDPVDRCPVAEATIRVEQASTMLELRSNREGAFQIPGLAAGRHRVSVSKPGYVSESFEIQVPHRGALHGLRVDIVQVRVRLLELYRSSCLHLLPRRELWARWTPRELAAYASRREGRRLHRLEALTALVERAYWAAEIPEEQLLSRAAELARAVPPAR